MGEYICHHGIKGQKHGRRRYQYPDGSLTPAGRIRYLGPGSEQRPRLEAPGGRSEYVDAEGYTVGYEGRTRRSRGSSEYTARGEYRSTPEKDAKDEPMNAKYSKVNEPKKAPPKQTKQAKKAKKKEKPRYDDDDDDDENDDNGNKKDKKKEKMSTQTASVKIASKVLDSAAKKHHEKLEDKRRHKPRMDLSEMSDADIRKAVDRYRLETSYNEIFAPSNVTQGEERVDKFLSRAATFAGVGVSIFEILDKMGTFDKKKNE